MAGTQKRMSKAAIDKINAEKRRQISLGLPQPTDSQALDALLGIEPVKPATRTSAKARKKIRKPPAKPSIAIIDSFILYAFKHVDYKTSTGLSNIYLKRVTLCRFIRVSLMQSIWEKSWADLYPEFMKDSNKDDSPFRNHISFRLKTLTELGILQRIPKEHLDGNKAGTYGLNKSGNQADGNVLLTEHEMEHATSVILLKPDLALAIPQFLTKKVSVSKYGRAFER